MNGRHYEWRLLIICTMVMFIGLCSCTPRDDVPYVMLDARSEKHRVERPGQEWIEDACAFWSLACSPVGFDDDQHALTVVLVDRRIFTTDEGKPDIAGKRLNEDVCTPVAISNHETNALEHEIGHAFTLDHDFENERNIMTTGRLNRDDLYISQQQMNTVQTRAAMLVDCL
jgi:hypothetical protein